MTKVFTDDKIKAASNGGLFLSILRSKHNVR